MADWFCSRKEEYRRPFGAVAEGTPVHFRLRLPVALGCRGAFLRVWAEGQPNRQDGMFWAGRVSEDDAFEWWECHFAPPTPALYFYDFELQTDSGKRILSRGFGGVSQVSEQEGGERWQLTCYGADFQTPDWLCGGVIYQIFPDRFASSGEPKAGVPSDRVLHSSWEEEPEWRPDEQGNIHNNDYFGGDLKGIEAHLDDLAALGVTCLYLNPIFEAHSNHRYNTADYERIDPLLGNEAEFRSLCEQAKKRGIRILLDGVFSHTGSDSRYFNKEGRYDTVGAYQSLQSPYASWYRFTRWPNEYAGWWGIDTLPETRETDASYLDYMTGEQGIVRRWLRAGADGWRLDVADELPDAFLDALRQAVKAEKPDGLILGEVWEDASCKVSYGKRRRYLLGHQLDSVMNYPFCGAILDFLRGGSASAFAETVSTIVEHYPPAVTRLLMNHIGTHDTPRALTVLGGEPAEGRGRDWQATQRLSPEQRERGLRLLKSAAALQYCLPGVPCLYYGDEGETEGYGDPFCRRTYPWGRENAELREWYRALGRLRKQAAVLREGDFLPLEAGDTVVCFARRDGENVLVCAVNRGADNGVVTLPDSETPWKTALGMGKLDGNILLIAPGDCAILQGKRFFQKTAKKC